jgi:hypothetical protein
MGMQPRKPQPTGAEGFTPSKGSSARDARDEKRAQPAGCSTMAHVQEDGPVIWEALPLLHEKTRGNGDRANNPNGDASARARAPRSRRSPGREGRPERGEPKRGPKECRESEGPIRAVTSGNGGTRTRSSKGDPCWREPLGGNMNDALTSKHHAPGPQRIAERAWCKPPWVPNPGSREPRQRKSRMVEISMSGSGEGPGWETGPGYSTGVRAVCVHLGMASLIPPSMGSAAPVV